MIKRLSVSRVEAVAFMLAVSALFLNMPARAQRPGRMPEFRHEFRVSLGGFPMGAVLASGHFPITKYDPALNPDSDRYRDYRENGTSYGTLLLQYDYNFRKWFTISANIGVDLLHGSLYDGYTRRRKGWQQAYGFDFYPEFRFTYFTKPAVRIYSSIGLGAGIYHNFNTRFGRRYNPDTDSYSIQDPWSAIPILQLMPFGVTFGRRLFGFAELQWGTLLVGGRVGVGYRF